MDTNNDTNTTDDSSPSDEELDALFLAEGVDFLDIKSIEHAIAAREAEIESAVERDALFENAYRAWHETLPHGGSRDDEPADCSPETMVLWGQIWRLQKHLLPLHESRLDAELVSEGVDLAEVNSIERAIAAKEAEVAAASERDEPFERAYEHVFEAWEQSGLSVLDLGEVPLPHSPETMALNEQLMRLRFHRHSIDWPKRKPYPRWTPKVSSAADEALDALLVADGIDLNDRESLIAAQGEHFGLLICAGPGFDTERERMSRIGYHRSRLEGPVQNRLNDTARKLAYKLDDHIGDCCNCARGGHYCDNAMRRVRKALKRVSRDAPTEAPERLILALAGVLGHVEGELSSVRVELNKTRRMVSRPLT